MNLPKKKILTSVILLLISVVGSAQNPGGGGQGPPPPQGAPPTPPGPLPIDNGLIILLAVALIYGVYRILKHSKKPKQA